MPDRFLSLIKQKAKKHPKKIFFPETSDKRILQAVSIISNEGTAKPCLLGEERELRGKFKKLKLKPDVKKITFVDSNDLRLLEKYTEQLYEIRKNQGLTIDEALDLIKNPNYFGVMAVFCGDADGMISGAASTTAETLRPALQILKTKEKFHKVSGFFFMVLNQRLLLFADCAVNIDPNSHDLADIAVDSAETAERFGIKPKIAMLSFSTAGSAKHPSVDKVREAVRMVQYYRPDLICDGEMQVDAAIDPEVCARKYPNSKIEGDANVLIFPNLDAANISYKLVEKLGRAKAIGPVIQGLKKPVNDLSRGCSVDDIVNLAAITSLEASNYRFKIPKCLF